MNKLFDKVITFTDIHFGLKNNSKSHNEDCLNFIKFLIEEAKKRGITKCIFMGDYFHNRSTINISTLDYGLKGITLLNDAFEETFFIIGNHDMYHKNKRDVTSVNMAKSFPNIVFIDEIKTIGDCTFVPFLVDDEYKKLEVLNSKYVFGHLELPGYLLNKMVKMQDHGKETEDTFKGCEYVFSGHFHKRQMKVTKSGTKIVYTGNCFPHDFSDVWDDLRGLMVLEHGGEPEFIAWDDAPKYRKYTMSDLLSNPDYYLEEDNTISRVSLDINCTVDDVGFIREVFSTEYKLREFNIETSRDIQEIMVERNIESEGTETIDEIVISQIKAIDSTTLDKDLLLEIYTTL